MLHFAEFADFHRAVGFAHSPTLPDFDVFRLDETTRVAVAFMPPFRKDWYQLVFKLNPARSVWLNDAPVAATQPMLLFNSPNHVYSWQVDTDLRAFIVLVKPEFLTAIPNIEQEFPFFGLTQPNLIPVAETEVAVFEGFFGQLLTISAGNDVFRRETIQALLTALLFRCKSAYQQQQQTADAQPRNRIIVGRFQALIHAFFLEKRTVAAYADLLNITPNYLNDVVKQTTGKNARHFIVERVMTEARNLLRHTDLDVNTVAHTLQFDEPTNFVKFFRQHAGQTPGQFRNQPKINYPGNLPVLPLN